MQARKALGKRVTVMFSGLRHAAPLNDREQDVELAQFEPAADVLCSMHSGLLFEKAIAV
jgi:hypothetical protein